MKTRHLTSNEVLEILKENHRQEVARGDADNSIEFDENLTIKQYCDAMFWDYPDYRGLGSLFNGLFQINVDDEQWKFILLPYKKRRLAYACGFIATQATISSDEPVQILGRTCQPAGIFLQIRDELHRRNVKVDDLRPSSPLMPYCVDHLQEMYATLIRVGRGRIPLIRISKPFYDGASKVLLAGILLFLISGISKFFAAISDFASLLQGLGAGLFLVGHLGTFIGADLKPRSVEMDGITDFRQLSRFLADKKNVTLA